MTEERAPDGIRLVCIDIDGTLVGADGVVHDAVWHAAARASALGIRLAVCSGRPGFGVTRELATRLEPHGIHCFQNGASIVDLERRRSLSTALAPETVGMLVARARETGRVLELYTDDDYAVEVDVERVRRHAALLGVVFAPRPLELLHAPVVRAQWLLAHAEVAALLAEPYPGLEVSPSLAPSMPDTTFVSVTSEGVTKGLAVREIAAAHGVPLQAVMYIGDGFNDAPAMRIAGWPVAVEGAEPVAMALARTTVAGPGAGGVAQALEMAMQGGPDA